MNFWFNRQTDLWKQLTQNRLRQSIDQRQWADNQEARHLWERRFKPKVNQLDRMRSALQTSVDPTPAPKDKSAVRPPSKAEALRADFTRWWQFVQDRDDTLDQAELSFSQSWGEDPDAQRREAAAELWEPLRLKMMAGAMPPPTKAEARSMQRGLSVKVEPKPKAATTAAAKASAPAPAPKPAGAMPEPSAPPPKPKRAAPPPEPTAPSPKPTAPKSPHTGKHLDYAVETDDEDEQWASGTQIILDPWPRHQTQRRDQNKRLHQRLNRRLPANFERS
jgi:hypothetical protein